ncbi:MAG: hypothetical protein AB1512_00595 [Thermodesulfobacteriota bacterium]
MPWGSCHPITNPCKIDTAFIDVKRGNNMREDDIERSEANHGRVTAG